MYTAAQDNDVRLSRDFFAIGFGNMIGGLFGSLPAMCGFSRSSINNSCRASSQFSLFVSVLVVTIIMNVAALLVRF